MQNENTKCRSLPRGVICELKLYIDNAIMLFFKTKQISFLLKSISLHKYTDNQCTINFTQTNKI